MSNSEDRKRETFVSVVIRQSALPRPGSGQILKRAGEFLDERFDDYEILIIGDLGISARQDNLDDVLGSVASVRILELAYAVDEDVAYIAGLENAIGDYVILFDPRQDPIDVVDEMLEVGLDGADVVVGIATNSRRSVLYRLARPFAGFLLSSIGYSLPRNATSLRCLSRAAVQSATKARNSNHRLYIRIAQCGLPTSEFQYQILEPATVKKGLRQASRETLRLLIFNSVAPLRLMSVVGFLGSLFAFLFAVYSFLSKLLKDNVAEGWSSIVIFMSFLFMLLFMMLSFFGEYLGRLLNEQSRHDPYWVVDEKNSTVMLDADRQNVTQRSA